MTNLEAIRQMNLEELAFFLCVTQWNEPNSIHMMPKEDIDYFTEYLNKDGSELIGSVKFCMEDWKKYMESEDNNISCQG